MLVEPQSLFDIVTQSPEEPMRLGRELAGALEPQCVVLLEGELGSGKTTLVKGVVAGLGARREEDVNSPTFTLVHDYGQVSDGLKKGLPTRVYHVDLYRIEEPRELSSLGLEDLMADRAIVIVEGGGKLRDTGAARRGRVRFENLGRSEERRGGEES